MIQNSKVVAANQQEHVNPNSPHPPPRPPLDTKQRCRYPVVRGACKNTRGWSARVLVCSRGTDGARAPKARRRPTPQICLVWIGCRGKMLLKFLVNTGRKAAARMVQSEFLSCIHFNWFLFFHLFRFGLVYPS